MAFALALTVSIARGQLATNSPIRQAETESMRSALETNNILPGSVMPATVPSFDRQLESSSEGAASSSRNRVMEVVQRRDEYAVRRYRQGFFQRFRVSGCWIDSASSDALEIAEFETSVTLAVPLGSFENLLLVTSGFEIDTLNDSSSSEVPSPLYDVGVDFMWRRQLSDSWGIMVAARPAVSSDFKTSEDGFRITGRALATWQWLPERLSVLFGVVYLDRNDVPILPGLGLIWTPDPDWRLDLIFPRPRLARRLVFLHRDREDWVYLSGSLGGRTWAVERLPGIPDQLTLRDYRLSLGWERIRDGGSGVFAEVGYVFGRELEYETAPQVESFGAAAMIRAGITY